MNQALEQRLSISVSEKPRILIVDDMQTNLQVLGNALNQQYQVFFAQNGKQAIEIANKQQPNLILMDIMMPEMSGYDVVKILKKNVNTSNIPVIFVTAMKNEENEKLGFEHQAVDYITKPISPAIVRARVKTHLSLVRVDELNKTRLEIIRCLGHAAEYKDNETGRHVIRMSKYSQILAKAIGLSNEECELIGTVAPMHDVGKIGIPDHILLKPGKLDEKEWALMRQHPFIGYQILGKQDSPLLKLAANIAYTHHEKWNGSGYPRGLKGKNIPLEGRIVAIADVFDALTTERPYKSAWSIEKAVSLIDNEAGAHFDPELVPIFIKHLDSILQIREQWLDKKD